MGTLRTLYLNILFVLPLILEVQSRFINFKPGYEYVYRFEGHSTVKDLGKFIVKAKVSYTNIESPGPDLQELLLKVHTFTLAPENDPDLKGGELDFSRWFSFVISNRGEIRHVYHPSNEDSDIIATKKGFAALFASRLHEEGDVSGVSSPRGFVYNVTENGSEGEHNSTYMVTSSESGLQFTKVRHGHPVERSTGSYTKTLHFHEYLGTIHSVLIDEDFTSPKLHHSFDPHANMRKVKAVNEFSNMEMPEMTYVSQGKLHFLTRHVDAKEWQKANHILMTTTIHVGNITQTKKNTNITVSMDHIEKNLTCMENQPPEGSHALAICFRNIVEIMKSMPDEDVLRIAEFYFEELDTGLPRNRRAKQNMIDVFGVLSTPMSDKILAEKIFLNPNPDPELVTRILTHLATKPNSPHEVLLQVLEDAVFHKEKFPESFYGKDTHSRCMLALGAVSHKLSKEGTIHRARRAVEWAHSFLGLHDPYEYRKKRALMSEKEKESYDLQKVILLETIGNARLDESYDYIISHINSTNSQWIKRAGCHALRKYDHQHAADTLLYAALFDEDQSVRYEAAMLYMGHPKGKMIAPFNSETTDNGTSIVDPYDAGIDVFDLTRSHHRAQRSIWDGLRFKLEAPSVDWQKLVGSKSIGASFGVIMMNLLDLVVAPTNGHVKVKVHDEAYARVHLGFIGVNIELFLARVCFKGGAEYSINILQGNDMKKMIKLAANFSKKLKEISEGIKEGVQLFKDIISGKLNLKDIISELVHAIVTLPQKVLKLREIASSAMTKIGSFDPLDLPAEFQPLMNFVHRVTKLFNDIKSDVMGFVHVCSLIYEYLFRINVTVVEVFKKMSIVSPTAR
uniref:Uncharacterized protein LOC111127102 n=1 Tax=Crassostrea virginica TaxID=6565 RepID=A0A8B8DLG6_CRAVI|nr:uncharacterized protein LOC111127102 [Crassostrea virginica]